MSSEDKLPASEGHWSADLARRKQVWEYLGIPGVTA
jgi:hypothetical protein